MTPAEREELAKLRELRDARKNKPGFAANVAWIERLIAELEAKESTK